MVTTKMKKETPMERFLNESEREELRSAIAEAERRTSAEIAVVIAGSSYEYPQAVWAGATVCAGTLATLVTIAASVGVLWTAPTLAHLWIFPAAFALGFAGFFYMLRGVPALKRLFIARDEIDEEVYEAAVAAFHDEGISRTAGANGVLIFVSLFERRVRILADHGLADKIDTHRWEEIVSRITAGIREHRQKEALVRAAAECAELLSHHFPPESGDRNELPDLTIRDEDR
jgi:putative membrane protein